MSLGDPLADYSVIEKVIKENRPAEWLLYIVSVVIVAAGIFTIVFGALKEQALLALVGSGDLDSFLRPASQYDPWPSKDDEPIIDWMDSYASPKDQTGLVERHDRVLQWDDQQHLSSDPWRLNSPIAEDEPVVTTRVIHARSFDGCCRPAHP